MTYADIDNSIYDKIYRKLAVLLKPLGDFRNLPDSAKFIATGFMDLNFDKTYQDDKQVIIALSHYYKQNGDMIPDPDMEIRIYLDESWHKAEALNCDNSFGYCGVYDNKINPKYVNTTNKKALNKFLLFWLSNIKKQGFKVANGGMK